MWQLKVFLCFCMFRSEVSIKGVSDMSVNFSTIGQMSQATISQKPTYSTDTTGQQPAASTAMDSQGHPKPKKSHWFIKTLATIVVLGAAVGLGRKYGIPKFDPKAALAEGAGTMDKVKHSSQKYLAVAGDFINSNVGKAWTWCKNLVGKGEKAA